MTIDIEVAFETCTPKCKFFKYNGGANGCVYKDICKNAVKVKEEADGKHE